MTDRCQPSVRQGQNVVDAEIHKLLDSAMLFNGMVTVLWEPATGEIHYISPNIEKWGFRAGSLSNISTLLEKIEQDDIAGARRKRMLTPGESMWIDFRMVAPEYAGGRRIHARIEPSECKDRMFSHMYLMDVTRLSEDSADMQPALPSVMSRPALEHACSSLIKQTGMPSHIKDAYGKDMTSRKGDSRLCMLICGTERGGVMCSMACRNLMIAARERKGVSYSFCECSGLAVACAPIMLGDSVLGYWFLGQIRIKGLTSDNVRLLSDRIGMSKKDAVDAFEGMREYSSDDVHHMSETLHTASLMLSGELQKRNMPRLKSREHVRAGERAERERIRRKNEELTLKLEMLATRDARLGTLNRSAMEARLEEISASGAADQWLMAVEVDNITSVKNVYGYDMGETLLRTLADYFIEELGFPGFVYRFSETTFVIMPDGYGKERFEELAETVMERFRHSWELPGHRIYCTISCGIAPVLGSLPSILNTISITLARATDRARNSYYVFDNTLAYTVEHRLELAGYMHDALENGCEGFEVYYQPIVDVSLRRWSHMEALLRWDHRRRGSVSPVEFIPIAEETSLIVPLTMFMLRRSFAQVGRMRNMGMPWLRINVNFSAYLAHFEGMLSMIKETLDETGLPPSAVTIELTESMAIFDMSYMSGFLRRLSDMGMLVALDDFGTGFSSLGSLRDLPVDIIKLDKSFSLKLDKDPYCHSVLDFVSGIARSGGQTVTCEGIESLESLRVACASGAKFIQGYLFSKPLPASKLEALLFDPASTAKLGDVLREVESPAGLIQNP